MYRATIFALVLCCIAQLGKSQKSAVGESLLFSSNSGVPTRINFYTTFPSVPRVQAWARGYDQDQYSVGISAIDTNGFTAVVSGYPSNIDLSWTATEIVDETLTDLGEGVVSYTFNIPPPNNISVPTITQQGSIVDVMGREIHFSRLNQLLHEKRIDQLPASTQSSMTKELVIRSDTVYVDDAQKVLQGWKSVTVLARRLISNGGVVNLQTPYRCHSLSTADTSCGGISVADIDKTGENGMEGYPSPDLHVYVGELDGNLEVINEASQGSASQPGGKGKKGAQGAQGPAMNCDSSCGRDCGGWATPGDTHHNKGRRGEKGGTGGPGRASGVPGKGGSVSDVIVYATSLSGSLTLHRKVGQPGDSAPNGFGGDGGDGGPGGCSCECNQWTFWCSVIGQDCYHDLGDPGPPGESGEDGFEAYSPNVNTAGTVGNADLQTIESVKPWFENDMELLNLIRRNGEMLFQRNDNDGAKAVFEFILSVTDESSIMYNEVAELLDYIEEGFDFYGNTEYYAPDKDWTDLKETVSDQLDVGTQLENTFNLVLANMNDIETTCLQVQSVVNLVSSTRLNQLEFKESDVADKKELYQDALDLIEQTMAEEMAQIELLVPIVMKELKQDQRKGLRDYLGGITACAVGIYTGNVETVVAGAMSIGNTLLAKPDCPAPSVESVMDSLEENLNFAFEYEEMDPADLDFSAMDASAVPIIMLSDLLKDRSQLLQDLRCLFTDTNSDDALDLERLINDYFRDGAFRIKLIDMLINMDAQLKQIGYNKELVAETAADVNLAVEETQNSVPMQGMETYTDMLLNLYQQQENAIMESIYELSKAYQFESLMDFHAIDQFSSEFSDQATVDNLGALVGMVQLQLIYQDLETQRDNFLDLTASSAGPKSHIFTAYWEYNTNNYPGVIKELQQTGQTMLNVNVDPLDPRTTGCERCYNGRLVGLYVEVDGDPQPSTVPSTTYVIIAHEGDSVFLQPTSDDGTIGVQLQQSPEDIDDGKIMDYDSSNYVSSVNDPQLQIKFAQDEYTFCEYDPGNFFGSKPCKSPYATYLLKVPKSDSYVCTLDPNYLISGSNCQDFDFTRLNTIRVYAKIQSWSNYPVDAEDVTRRIRKLKMEEDSD